MHINESKSEFFYPYGLKNLNKDELKSNYYLKISTHKDGTQTAIFAETNTIRNLWMSFINRFKLNSTRYIYGNELSDKFKIISEGQPTTFTVKFNDQTRENIKKFIKLFFPNSPLAQAANQNPALTPIPEKETLILPAEIILSGDNSEEIADQNASSASLIEESISDIKEEAPLPDEQIQEEIIEKKNEIEDLADKVKNLYNTIDNTISCKKTNDSFGLSLEDMRRGLYSGEAMQSALYSDDTKEIKIKILRDPGNVPLYIVRHLGNGEFGKAFAYISLDKDSPSTGVMKIASPQDKQNIAKSEENAGNEAKLSQRIHRDGEKVGVQKPVHKVELLLASKKNGTKRRFATMGIRYDTDLFKLTNTVDENNNPIKEPLSDTKKIEASLQLLQGLISVHKANIIHGDIKGENILVNKTLNRYDLADWGGATDKPTEKVTRTPGFFTWAGFDSAQEAFEKDHGDQWFNIMQKEDVFALGLTFYQMFANNSYCTPYYSDEKGNLIIDNDYFPALAKSEDGPLHPIDNFLKKMMARDPADRPTAKEAFLEFQNIARSFQQRK